MNQGDQGVTLNKNKSVGYTGQAQEVLETGKLRRSMGSNIQEPKELCIHENLCKQDRNKQKNTQINIKTS